MESQNYPVNKVTNPKITVLLANKMKYMDFSLGMVEMKDSPSAHSRAQDVSSSGSWFHMVA